MEDMALNVESLKQPLFVFAHYDDSVLSAFYALWMARKSALEVVVCGGAPQSDAPGDWDVSCGFRSSNAAMKARYAEHRRIFSVLNIETVSLPVLDDQYGGSEAVVWEDARAALLSAARRFEAKSIVTHSARSHHPDHQRVVNLAMRVAETLDLALWHTCDRPYFDCSEHCCSELGAESAAAGGPTILLPRYLYYFKRALVSLYRSQKSALNSVFGKAWNKQARMRSECYRLRRKASAEPQAPAHRQ
jgi:LmbE family N-acetylglucosaminyl deacetylase